MGKALLEKFSKCWSMLRIRSEQLCVHECLNTGHRTALYQFLAQLPFTTSTVFVLVDPGIIA